MESLFVYALIFGPAVIGLGALVLGLTLLTRKDEAGQRTTASTIVAVLCLLVTLGIGACYGMMFLGNL